MERMSQITMTNKVKKHIRFHFLLTEIQLGTLTLLGLNKLFKKYLAKSKINQSLIVYLKHNLMTFLYRMYNCRKNFIPTFFSQPL